MQRRSKRLLVEGLDGGCGCLRVGCGVTISAKGRMQLWDREE
jgi:hypothetical protein